LYQYILSINSKQLVKSEKDLHTAQS